MELTEINKKKTPELFFLPVDRMVDGKTVPIIEDGIDTGEVEKEYTLAAVVDKTVSTEYDLLKRKSAKGISEHRSYNDYAEIWHEIDGKQFKLAQQKIFLEYLEEKKWVRVKAEQKIDEISLTKETDTCRVDVDSETNKQTFTVQKKGFIVRCAWVITRYSKAYADCIDDLKLDCSDYTGKISDTDWVDDVRTIVFEPDGVKDSLVIDPYLGIDEQSTYIDVTCDGYVLRFVTTTSDYNLRLRNAANTIEWAYSRLMFETGTDYYWRYDPNKTLIILENTPTRVVLQGTFIPHTSGAVALPECNECVIIYTIYSDRLTYELRVDATETGFSLFSSPNYGFCRFAWNNGGVDAEGFIEDNGSEVETSHGYLRYNTGGYKYGLSLKEWCNYQLIPVYSSTGTWALYNRYNAYTIGWGGESGITLTGSDNVLVWEVILDSSERENITPTTAWASAESYTDGELVIEAGVGYECLVTHFSAVFADDLASGYWVPCHLYPSAQRLEQGVQYTMPSTLDITTGAAVTSGAGTTSIGSLGFNSDGAYHIEGEDV